MITAIPVLWRVVTKMSPMPPNSTTLPRTHPHAGQEPRGPLGDGLRSFRHKDRLRKGLD
jgi:hypothetical protein